MKTEILHLLNLMEDNECLYIAFVAATEQLATYLDRVG